MASNDYIELEAIYTPPPAILEFLESRGTQCTLKKHLQAIQEKNDQIFRFSTDFVSETHHYKNLSRGG